MTRLIPCCKLPALVCHLSNELHVRFDSGPKGLALFCTPANSCTYIPQNNTTNRLPSSLHLEGLSNLLTFHIQQLYKNSRNKTRSHNPNHGINPSGAKCVEHQQCYVKKNPVELPAASTVVHRCVFNWRPRGRSTKTKRSPQRRRRTMSRFIPDQKHFPFLFLASCRICAYFNGAGLHRESERETLTGWIGRHGYLQSIRL